MHGCDNGGHESRTTNGDENDNRWGDHSARLDLAQARSLIKTAQRKCFVRAIAFSTYSEGNSSAIKMSAYNVSQCARDNYHGTNARYKEESNACIEHTTRGKQRKKHSPHQHDLSPQLSTMHQLVSVGPLTLLRLCQMRPCMPRRTRKLVARQFPTPKANSSTNPSGGQVSQSPGTPPKEV